MSGSEADERSKEQLNAAIKKAEKIAAMIEHRNDLGTAMHYRIGLAVETVDVLYDLASIKYGDGRS